MALETLSAMRALWLNERESYHLNSKRRWVADSNCRVEVKSIDLFLKQVGLGDIKGTRSIYKFCDLVSCWILYTEVDVGMLPVTL